MLLLSSLYVTNSERSSKKLLSIRSRYPSNWMFPSLYLRPPYHTLSNAALTSLKTMETNLPLFIFLAIVSWARAIAVSVPLPLRNPCCFSLNIFLSSRCCCISACTVFSRALPGTSSKISVDNFPLSSGLFLVSIS